MAKKRNKSGDGIDTKVTDSPDILDDPIPTGQAESSTGIQNQDSATEIPRESTDQQQFASTGEGYAAAVEKKKYITPADPFGVENIKAGENRVRLLKSEGEGAWVIRFDHNPNLDKGPNGEIYSKENPHPVLKMLKQEEGYRWGFDGGDGKGGWGKAFTGDAYGADHIEARRVLHKAADLIGQPKVQGRSPD